MANSNAADYQRIRRLYQYLCTCLAMKRKPDGTPNFKGMSDRISDSSEFRRIVSSLFQEDFGGIDPATQRKIASATTGGVVEMLGKLRKSLHQEYRNHEESYERVLTPEDVLAVLYRLVELTAQEQKDLGLTPGDGLTLLQRALLILQTTGGVENYDMLLHIYKAAVGLEATQGEGALQNLREVDHLIEETVKKALTYLPDRTHKDHGAGKMAPSRQETITELTQKAQREIRRLMARSGNQQSLVPGSTVVDSYIRHYLQPAFIAKLAQTVVANERLTDQFPVYLKRITLEASGPLPFADRELGTLSAKGPFPRLLHPALRQLELSATGQPLGDLPGPGDYELASQEATRVVVEFYVKVPTGYQPVVGRVFERLTSEDRQRLDFSLSSTGIGGALSHVIKVINTALLLDIPCLRDYFSIAHDVACTQEIIRDNVPSPVWAHNLVKLCHKATVAETLRHCDRNPMASYEAFAFADPIGHGDYCGFDFLLSQAQAALQARLQAVRNAGVMPETYISHLCQRIEYWEALKDAWSYLRGYPFSSLAMMGTINREILLPNVGTRPLTRDDAYIYFDACLSIAEALLDEGAYRAAHHQLRRLQVVEEFVQQGLNIAQSAPSAGEPFFEVFSGGLIVRYLICLANYYYLYDTQDRDLSYLPLRCNPDVNRQVLIQQAWATLSHAQHHVAVRLRKYVIINEVSQGTFHPHYSLLSRIAMLRAKMLLFFPQFVPKDDRLLPSDRFSGQQRTAASIHWGRLYLMEKARLYAAADGDSEVYACHAALQCWLQLLAAYASPADLSLPTTPGERQARDQTLAKCLQWAKQLRDHALISYADTGRQCYYQIKEKSGLPTESDEFGRYSIQKLPAIYETRGQGSGQPYQADRELLVLDIDLLGLDAAALPKLSPNHPTRNIYLFGTNACYLFFARGLYLLCSDSSEEFHERPDQPIEWQPKLLQATRLLDMAWAIAEQGGTLQKDKTSGELRFQVVRHFHGEAQLGQFASQEVSSVRDLYPRRVTEIADLGRVFSAACRVLRLHGASPAEQAQLRGDIEALLATLHSAHSLSRTARAILARQSRFNGHLQSYLNRVRPILLSHANQAQHNQVQHNQAQGNQAQGNQEGSPAIDLSAQRNALVRELFLALGT